MYRAVPERARVVASHYAEAMNQYVIQAVIEVPMSRYQARRGALAALQAGEDYGATSISLTGYSVLRGLTFLELVVEHEEGANPTVMARVGLAHLILEAEGSARGGESEEFALLFAEGFIKGHEHQPEAILLPEVANELGIGGTDQAQDDAWALLLSRYYNPATRQPGEVAIKKTKA